MPGEFAKGDIIFQLERTSTCVQLSSKDCGNIWSNWQKPNGSWLQCGKMNWIAACCCVLFKTRSRAGIEWVCNGKFVGIWFNQDIELASTNMTCRFLLLRCLQITQGQSKMVWNSTIPAYFLISLILCTSDWIISSNHQIVTSRSYFSQL